MGKKSKIVVEESDSEDGYLDPVFSDDEDAPETIRNSEANNKYD